MTGADFEAAVIARSHELPVVVDFWAAWCGPCRALGPLIEREVSALGGRVELARIDTDQEPQLAARFAVQGIPAVKAFRGGKVVAEFVGARDAGFLRTWLGQLAPSPGRVALERGLSAEQAGDLAAAEAALEPLLDDAEVGSRAALALAELRLRTGRVEGVSALLDRVDPRSDHFDRVEGARRRLGFHVEAAAHGGEAAIRAALGGAPKDVALRYALGCALAARGEIEGALEAWLEVVSCNRKYRDDAARLAMLALFEQLGDSDLARDYRRKLQIVM